jgi:transposase-like protein
MQIRYTKKFKIEAVRKVLLRKKGTPKTLIARLLGVNNPTLHGWVKSVKTKI